MSIAKRLASSPRWRSKFGSGPIDLRVVVDIDMRRIGEGLDGAALRVHKRIGYLTMSKARRSIKKRLGPSRPYQPPHSHLGHLKRKIFYDASIENMVAGPLMHDPAEAPVLEYGGRVRGEAGYGSPEAFLEAGWGPLIADKGKGRLTRSTRKNRIPRGRIGRVRVLRGRIRTVAQARQASRLFFDFGLPGSEKAYSGERTVAPRPYMNPAFDKAKEQLPMLWENSVR